MEKQLKTLLLLYEKKLYRDIPKDIKTLFSLEIIISYLGYQKALIFVINTRKLNWIRYLVEERGVDISYKDFLVFRTASKKGHLEVVKYLVKQGAHIHAKYNYSLIWASRNGHLEVVKYLVEQGAHIHANDDDALRWASNNNHLGVVKYLIEQGVNIHSGDDWALKCASYHGYFEMVKYLVEQGAHIYTEYDLTLGWASHNGHLKVVNYLKQVFTT